MKAKEAVGAMLLAACVAGCASQRVNVPEPQTILADIDSQGPSEVLWKQLWADESVFDAVFDQIASGDPLWLEIAQRLRPVSDAGATLLLNYAVARALPLEPVRVLQIIGNGFAVSDVCTSPFLEPEPGIAEEYAQRARSALLTVEDPQLQSVRDTCLSLLTLK